MDKIKANFREFVKAKTTKAMAITSLACCMLAVGASAEGTADASTVTTAFTTGFQTIVDNGIAMIAGMVPIALGLAGVIFLVKKGMSWFKGVAK